MYARREIAGARRFDCRKRFDCSQRCIIMLGLINSCQLSLGKDRQQRYTKFLGRKLADECHSWAVSHAASSFANRVTNIKWHPVHSDSVVAYGTFGGDITLWDYRKHFADCPIIRGIGMGYGCITEMRFHLDNPSWIYTTAVDGMFRLQDFEGIASEIIDNRNSEVTDVWYTALDLSVDYQLIAIGDNRGNVDMRSLDDHKVVSSIKRLHKGKVKYLEFCPARSWMFVTTSTDRTMKLWDVRMIKSQRMWVSRKSPEPLSTSVHSGLVSSAYFDPVLGVRILTTSQNGELRVYSPHNLWREPTSVIKHPHRNFQHMTDIKATWHPVYEDLCVVGRYPGKGDHDQSRTIDLIDVEAEERIGYFYNPELGQLIQVNQFNKSGTCLASGMSRNGLIWKSERKEEDGIVTKCHNGRSNNSLNWNGEKEVAFGRGNDGSHRSSIGGHFDGPSDPLANFRKRKRSSKSTKGEKKLKVSVSTRKETREKKKKNKK